MGRERDCSNNPKVHLEFNIAGMEVCDHIESFDFDIANKI